MVNRLLTMTLYGRAGYLSVFGTWLEIYITYLLTYELSFVLLLIFLDFR